MSSPLRTEEKYRNIKLLSRDLRLGKEAAFDYLFCTRYKGLVRYAESIVRDTAAAEDIVQDIFSSIWQKSDRIKPGFSIDSYLHVSVYNRCINSVNSHAHRKGAEEVVKRELYKEEEAADGTDEERYRKLRAGIGSLPLQCREVLNLVAFEGMKYKEVADSLNISQNTVKTQVKIAYRKLREEIDPIV